MHTYIYTSLVLHFEKLGRFHGPVQLITDAAVLQNSFEIVLLVMSTTRLKGHDPLPAHLIAADGGRAVEMQKLR